MPPAAGGGPAHGDRQRTGTAGARGPPAWRAAGTKGTVWWP